MLWQSKDERVIVLRGDLVYQYVTYLVGPILNTRPRIWVSCHSRSETSFTSRTRCSAGSWGHGWPCVLAATTRRPRKALSLTETGGWGSDVVWWRGGRSTYVQHCFAANLNHICMHFLIFFFSAEQIFLSTTHTEAEKENTPTKSRSLLFKRKAARRSKSLGKDHWEDVIFCKIACTF